MHMLHAKSTEPPLIQCHQSQSSLLWSILRITNKAEVKNVNVGIATIYVKVFRIDGVTDNITQLLLNTLTQF